MLSIASLIKQNNAFHQHCLICCSREIHKPDEFTSFFPVIVLYLVGLRWVKDLSSCFYIAAAMQSTESRLVEQHHSRSWSCGSIARDVLPWQPSSTDPVMGCLVCQCGSCGLNVCVEDVRACLWCQGGKREELRHWKKEKTKHIVSWLKKRKPLIRLF